MSDYVIGIVGHESRQKYVDHLTAQVEADFVSVDDGTLGCDQNHKRVHQHLAEMNSEWAVVLEDDAVPIEGFRKHLGQALYAAPSPVVSLYLGQSRPPQWMKRIRDAIAKADANGTAWITGTILLHAVAVAIKTEHIPAMLRRVRKLTRDMPIDQAIGYWARIDKIGPISYTWPSLVDHADIPTVAKHKDGSRRIPGRTAWKIGTPVSWDTQPVQLYDPTNPLAGGD